MSEKLNRVVISVLLLLAVATTAIAEDYYLESPDGKNKAVISISADISLKLLVDGKEVFKLNSISLVTDLKGTLGKSPSLISTNLLNVDQVVMPVVKVKSAEIKEHYNQLTLSFKNDFDLILRAYDDCFAYRFRARFEGPFKVVDETANLKFPAGTKVHFPTEESFLTHSERLYEYLDADNIGSGKMSCLPALFEIPQGARIAVTESDLYDYPGLYLTGDDEGGLNTRFPRYALEEKRTRDRTVEVSKRAEYLAKVKGPRSFPWRAFIVAAEDSQLITNQSVFLLASPCRIKDPAWIKPGKVAWDWWNANNVYNVPFKAGINTATYKFYIDFAAKYGLEYIILDEGWSEPADIFKINPEIDMEELSRYAKEKKVGLILWVVWKALDEKLEAALDQFAKWDVKGIKVDFMQRDDQWMVNYYWRVAEAAARRKLLVDFHGSYKPSGLQRTYPNVVTREGVKGLENYKWSENPSPDHNLTLPFIRMLAGAMDYTPGAMINAQRKNFKAVFTRPMSMGTRCHQLAMYVVFESPLQMLADSPSNYLREPECMEYLKDVPTVWDETRVIKAKVGDFLVLARRSGATWYLAGMTDETAREFELKLDFLEDGQYHFSLYQDGPNAERHGNDFVLKKGKTDKTQKLKIRMATAGGFAAVFNNK